MNATTNILDEVFRVVKSLNMGWTFIGLVIATVMWHFRTLQYRYFGWCVKCCRLNLKKANKPYVKRIKIEGELETALKSDESPTVLVFGGRGNGKSTILRNLLAKRNAVIWVSASAESLDQITKFICAKIHKFLPPDLPSMQEALLASRIPAIIVISISFDTPGSTVRQLVQYAKTISFDNKETNRQPRIILEISNSRAAITGGLTEEEYRIEAVEVGPFSQEEALMLVSPMIPTTLRDERRRNQLAEKIVNEYDLKAVWLIRICDELKKIISGDPKDFEQAIDDYWNAKVHNAKVAWTMVRAYLIEKAQDEWSREEQTSAIKNLVTLLNKNPVVNVEDALHALNNDRLSFGDLSEMNAITDMRGHVFYIHPFQARIGWNGKAAKQGANAWLATENGTDNQDNDE